MKRTKWLLIGAFISLLALIVVLGGVGNQQTLPRYVAGAPAAIVPFDSNYYEWIVGRPFTERKVWLWTSGKGTNLHRSQVFLYDLERRAIVGELQHAGTPALWSLDHSRLLVQGPDSEFTTFRHKVQDCVARWLGNKARVPRTRTETYWLLDTRSNTVRKMGSVEQQVGGGSNWSGSPSGRYGYTVPSVMWGHGAVVCDLERGTLWKIILPGLPRGWWTEQELLVAKGTNNFVSFDILTRQTRALFTPSSIAATLSQAGLTNPPQGLDTLATWNGHEYAFYFADKERIHGLHEPESFLLKADRTGPSLNLAYRNFEFHWDGHLDPTGTHYLYEGEPGKPGRGGDGAVYWRNLTNNTTVALVPPDNKGQYSIPRLYGDQVVYFKNRLVWRINLNGSTNEPLLRP